MALQSHGEIPVKQPLLVLVRSMGWAIKYSRIPDIIVKSISLRFVTAITAPSLLASTFAPSAAEN